MYLVGFIIRIYHDARSTVKYTMSYLPWVQFMHFAFTRHGPLTITQQKMWQKNLHPMTTGLTVSSLQETAYSPQNAWTVSLFRPYCHILGQESVDLMKQFIVAQTTLKNSRLCISWSNICERLHKNRPDVSLFVTDCADTEKCSQ